MAILINAKKYKEEEIKRLKQEVELIEKNIGRKPKLMILKATDNKACEAYIRNKVNIGNEIGLDVNVKEFDENCTTLDIMTFIQDDIDVAVDGIILQEPVYRHIDSSIISTMISFEDADCFNVINLGYLLQNESKVSPCTPSGVIDILNHHDIEIEGKRVTVIGRSVNVGLSLSIMLTQLGAVVTTTHSKSKDLKQDIQNADIVISCVGKRNLIKPEWMKEGSVLLGVGITYENGKQYTDYDIDEMITKSKCSMIGDRVNCTGIATVINLMKNTINLCKRYNKLK